MVTRNRYLADLGHAIDSATANKYLTVDDSGGSFENIQYSQVVNVPNILDSADVINVIDSAHVNARVDLSAYSTTSYVDTEISNLVGGAPANLDTLNELAAAINDDATFQTTITNLINGLPDSSQVSTIVTSDVDKAFVDALNVDADTLDGQQGTYYTNYNNLSNTPNVLDSAQTLALVAAAGNVTQAYVDNEIAALPDSAQVSGIITADVDKAFVDALNVDADTLDGQDGTYYLNYNNFTNTPNVLDSTNVNTLVNAGIANVVDAAPASLNTLNELAAAIDDDASFNTTITNAINALPDSAQVSGIITADVDKAFVDALNVDADTLDGQQGTYYLDYTNATNKPTILDSANITSIIDSAHVRARGWDSANTSSIVDSAYVLARGWDSANTTSLVDSSYISARVTPNAGLSTFTYNTTSGQTEFTGADADSATLAYNTGSILVFYNGILMKSGDDYTATDGTTITLTEGADSGGTMSIFNFGVGLTGGAGGGGGGGVASFVMGGDTYLFHLGWENTPNHYNTRRMEKLDLTVGGAATYGYTYPPGSINLEGVAATGDASHVVMMGGEWDLASNDQSYQYIQTFAISTGSTNYSIGDLDVGKSWGQGAGDLTYGLYFGGGSGSNGNTTNSGIQYFTHQTSGNAQAFGNMSVSSNFQGGHGIHDGTYAITLTPSLDRDTMEYVTVQTQSNSSTFGALSVDMFRSQGGYDATRGVIVPQDTSLGMEFITMATPGNSQTFGNLDVDRIGCGTGSNGTVVGIIGGYDSVTGNRTQNSKITVQTLGDAVDFGDLSLGAQYATGASGT